MRLELGTFPVSDARFGQGTRWQDGVLTIDREAVLGAVRDDALVAIASLEIAKPGESVRIWPVRDVVEPRTKVSGPGVAYPGWFGRSIETVGRGRTHRLAGIGVTEVSSVNWHDAGGDFVDEFIDMSGPWAELTPQSGIVNVCLVVEPEPTLTIQTKNEVVHRATLTVSDALAAAVRDLAPPELEVFELSPAPASLPGVVYIQCVHSPQAMSHSEHTFCTGTYGLTRLTPPWLLHPNEILDGALSGPYRTLFATSWTVVNNPILLDLYRRHGRDLRLLGVIAFRTEWTTQSEKDLMAEQAAKLAQMLGAQGAIVTWDAGGNEYIEVVHTVRACERLGIKTVLLTSEDSPEGGAPSLLKPVPEADAIVTTGFFNTKYLDIGTLPPVERVIGYGEKAAGRAVDATVVGAPRVGRWGRDPAALAPRRSLRIHAPDVVRLLMAVVVRGARMLLVHAPGLVRHGSKPARELARDPSLLDRLSASLRPYEAAAAYPPNRVFLGALSPDALAAMPRPWFEASGPVEARGPHGFMVPEEAFYGFLKADDEFDVVWLDERLRGGGARRPRRAPAGHSRRSRAGRRRQARVRHPGTNRDRSGPTPRAPRRTARRVRGRAHEEDASLASDVLLENLTTKTTAVLALRTLIADGLVDPEALPYVINSGEEAVGDRYQRGGGNLAKAVAERCACRAASGADVKAFCCGPVHAFVSAAALVARACSKKWPWSAAAPSPS